MSYNHPLWAQLDLPAAKKALERLAPTLEGRLAKAHTDKEKAYLEAVNQLFYAPGDKLARDNAYSDAMARLYERWPDDHEVSIFYALSLLGTVRPGDKGFRRQALAASIAIKVFQENPNHPGAAHFIIHAFDDPDHAILALPAARVYAKIAPAAPHALHMPSHIFVQLGMWQDVVASNIVAHKAAVDLIARMHLPEGREDFHTLSWLEYANLMLGKFDEARRMWISPSRPPIAIPRTPTSHSNTTRCWLATSSKPASGKRFRWRVRRRLRADHESMPGMPGMGGQYSGQGAWIFIAGLSAAKLGDANEAERARAKLSAMRQGRGIGRRRLRRKAVRHHGKRSRLGGAIGAWTKGRGRALWPRWRPTSNRLWPRRPGRPSRSNPRWSFTAKSCWRRAGRPKLSRRSNRSCCERPSELHRSKDSREPPARAAARRLPRKGS